MSNLDTHIDGRINPAPLPLLFETGTAEIDAVLQQSRVAPAPVEPSITATSTFVMVPKLYTTPARVEISLRVNSNFSRTGVLTPSGNRGAIQIFKSATGGTVMAFNGQDNEFQGQELEIGVTLFAEGVTASNSLGDFTLTLDLAAGPTPIGGPASISLTAVALTLDICTARTASGGDPPALPQPTTSQPPPGTNTDKWFGGRLLNEQDNTLSQERATLIVRQPRPRDFNGQLVLRGVEVNGTTIGALTDKAKLFAIETPSLVQLAFGNPRQFGGVPANGVRFFVQGARPSATSREVGFQLGIAGVENDGDRVAVTVGVAPVITAASPIVVKKQPVNPARKAVTLRTSSTFGGTGTLSRSGNTGAIKLFKSDGTEISFTANPVFTDLELSAGVQLLAEGVAASGSLNDYVLTLSLTSSGIVQAGNPITARLTAFEFTLDVAVSRTAAGVEPAVMPPPPAAAPAAGTATDKFNLGRFVQVRDPGFSHERAMLIIRRSNPEGFVGTLTLTPINAQVQAFVAEVPANGQAAAATVASPFTVLSAAIPANGTRLFVEGLSTSTAVRDTGFRLGIQGGEAETDKVAMTIVQIEVIDTVTNVAAATFVQFGLWDGAFRPAGAPLGTLFNEEAEADNFAGADSRRFHLRVRDIAKQNAGHVQADWRTSDEHNNDLDAPATRDVTLVETPANSGVFVSRGLLLVSDEADQLQATHSGLAAPLPDAGLRQGVGLRNHRTRKCTVRGSLRVDYKPIPAIVLPLNLPAFQRTPEARRRLPLQIFVLKVARGAPNGVTLTAPGSAIWDRDLRVAEETFARLGIEVETVVAPGTPAGDIKDEQPFIANETVLTSGPNAFTLRRNKVINDPRNKVEVRSAAGGSRTFNIFFDDDPRAPNSGEVKINRATGTLTFKPNEQPGAQDRIVASYVVVGHQLVLLDPPAGVNPLAVRFRPVDDEASLATNSPALPNTIRVYYTGGLPSQGAAAESWPDINFAAKPQVGCSFISAPQSGLGTLAHELGHVLANKTATINTGHYSKPALPANNRLEVPQNLMANLASPGAGGATIRKRLWDAIDADGVVNQFTAIRGSRFSRGF